MQPAIQSAQPDVVLGSKSGTALTSGRLNMSPGKISSASLLSQSASTHGPSASGEPGVPSRVGPTNNPGGVPGASSPLTGGLASTCSAIIVKIVWTTRNNCPVAICRKVATGMPISDIRGGSVRQSRSVVKPDVFRSHH